MISAIDTNILLDVFLPDKRFAEQSARLLKLAYDEGALIICESVYLVLSLSSLRSFSRLCMVPSFLWS
jgi:hypothetical protein